MIYLCIVNSRILFFVDSLLLSLWLGFVSVCLRHFRLFFRYLQFQNLDSFARYSHICEPRAPALTKQEYTFLNKLKINVVLMRINVNGNKQIMRRIHFMNNFIIFSLLYSITSVDCCSLSCIQPIHAYIPQGDFKARVILCSFFIEVYCHIWASQFHCVCVFFPFFVLLVIHRNTFPYHFYRLKDTLEASMCNVQMNSSITTKYMTMRN